jgi:hypothetical protein
MAEGEVRELGDSLEGRPGLKEGKELLLGVADALALGHGADNDRVKVEIAAAEHLLAPEGQGQLLEGLLVRAVKEEEQVVGPAVLGVDETRRHGGRGGLRLKHGGNGGKRGFGEGTRDGRLDAPELEKEMEFVHALVGDDSGRGGGQQMENGPGLADRLLVQFLHRVLGVVQQRHAVARHSRHPEPVVNQVPPVHLINVSISELQTLHPLPPLLPRLVAQLVHPLHVALSLAQVQLHRLAQFAAVLVQKQVIVDR